MLVLAEALQLSRYYKTICFSFVLNISVTHDLNMLKTVFVEKLTMKSRMFQYKLYKQKMLQTM